LRPKVEQELDKLEKQNILTPVQVSDWASPVIPVLKKDGRVRISGDFKVTLNSCLRVDQYPMPKIDDIFANLAGGQKFGKIDLRQTYLQRLANMSFRVISHLDSSLAMVNDFIIFQSSWILFNHFLPNKAGPPRLTKYKLRYEH
jgi:hypothetical protein